MDYTKDINNNILRAMEDCGYTALRPVQKTCFPLLAGKKQIAVQASTGSGKTLAFLAPALSLVKEDNAHTQILILSPSRELALQTCSAAEKLTAYTRIHCIALIGGLDIRKQKNALRNNPHVLIGTPGRIVDLLAQNAIDLTRLTYVILDEADQLISTGQQMETETILSCCHCPSALFSATLTENTLHFMRGAYETVKLDEMRVNNDIHLYIFHTRDKTASLLKILRYVPIDACIIFVNYRSSATKLASLLQSQGMLAKPFSSDYDEKTRIRVLKEFTEGKTRLLIATDAAARGLDLSGVSHIIHYDLAKDEETFIHRSGRTAHQSAPGSAIILFDEQDENLPYAEKLKAECEPLVPGEEPCGNLEVPALRKKSEEPVTTTLVIHAGRRDKLRPKDIIGALCAIMPFEDIGTLEIQDTYSTVILKKTVSESLFQHLTIKGKHRKVHIAQK